jgi:hypothetical protein
MGALRKVFPLPKLLDGRYTWHIVQLFLSGVSRQQHHKAKDLEHQEKR